MSNTKQKIRDSQSSPYKTDGLRIPFAVDVEHKEIIEYNVFKRINQSNQFAEDKANCTDFRFYGYINEVVNLKLPKETFTKQPLFRNFDFSTISNWATYLMAPLANSNGTKGDTSVIVSDNGNARSVNFTYGLPALVIPQATIGNRARYGLLLYLGHNFKVNDVMQLRTTEDDDRYPNGLYRVVKVLGKKVYIQFIKTQIIDQFSISNVTGATITDSVTEDENASIGGVELGITPSYLTELLNRPNDVNWLAIYNPHIFVKKLVNSVPSEYYMKKLYGFGTISSDIFNCAFARNSYNQKTFTYAPTEKFDFRDKKTNLQTPVTDVYVVFVKDVVAMSGIDPTNVLSSFQNFVTSTFDEGAMQLVQTTSPNTISYSLGKNFLYHSLVEYNTETLLEVELNKMHHTFLANNSQNPIRFSYDPFYHISIKKLSNNISYENTKDLAPSYATFSNKYQNYRWREVLDVGFFEDNNNGVDFPYLNDAFYVYSNILLNIKNHKSPKNPTLLSGGYLISSFTETVVTEDETISPTGNDQLDDSLFDANKGDKPYEEYSGRVC